MRFKVLLIVVCFLSCVACKRLHTVAVVQPSYRSEHTTAEATARRDSIYIDRWHTIYQKGDTVYKIDSTYKSNTKAVHDTIKIIQTDTIINPQIIEVEKKVYIEKQLNKIQQTAIKSGYLFWLLLLLFVGYKFLKIAKHFYGI